MADNKKPQSDGNVTEDVLREAGKSEDEVRRTGAIDRADEGVEALFGERAKTVNSPIHRLIWGSVRPDAFIPAQVNIDLTVDEAIEACLAVVRKHHTDGTIYNEHGKIRVEVLQELGAAGYWGMRIDPKFGGKGASDRSFMRMLTRMAMLEATIAGLASIHGCIGAVDPLAAFGNDTQKEMLRKLASGERLSAFALTEPGAGSDMTALKTVAIDRGDHWEVNGEKLFISNAIPGRTIGLVVMIDGKPSVLIADLPEQENETFQLKRYKIGALKRTYNNGLIFNKFRVPKENLLDAPMGNGLIIAYHGLNYGRVALCANAAGVMRVMLRSITPNSWAAYRKTYGQPIENRELVQRRVARLAGMIVSADALVSWCSGILDAGYRGELECIVAKIYGSEAQKEAAIEILMKTHGGRAFLEGHMFGDNILDFLAPCIYEGEGQMLGMAFFKSLAKDHGMKYMLPLGDSVKALTKGKVLKGGWGLASNGTKYATWFVPRALRHEFGKFLPWLASAPFAGVALAPFRMAGKMLGLTKRSMNKRLKGHVSAAYRLANETALDLSGAMRAHQIKLADRQCVISELSQRALDVVTIIITAQSAVGADEATQLAADISCQDLLRKLTGERPNDAYFKQCVKLAELVAAGKFHQMDSAPGTAVMQQYSQE